MNRTTRLAGVLLASALAFPATALAQTFIATAQVELAVRAGPGPTYPIVGVIPASGGLTVFGCISPVTWCDVAYGGVRGWVYAQYIVYQAMPLPQAPQPPVVVFEGDAYWTQYYANQPFFAERDRWLGGAAGAAGGATIGALVFGPVGAAIGAAVGGALGAATVVTPPPQVIAYVQQQQPQQVFLEGEVVVGAVVPPPVVLQPIPDYQYSYAFINGQWVLVEPVNRQIVFIIR